MSKFRTEELPDGSVFAPQKLSISSGSKLNNDDYIVRKAEYIGSFVVDGADQKTRAEYLRKELEKKRVVPQSMPVLLVFSLTGIKVCNETGESVHMAHALRRISYATCDPEYCQFSFLARVPKGQASVQYCHAFLTETPDQAEELNSIVGDAFKLAYAQQQRAQSQPQPSFNEVIEKQLQANRSSRQRVEEQAQEELNKRLHRISTPTVPSELAQQRKELRQEHRQRSGDDHGQSAHPGVVHEGGSSRQLVSTDVGGQLVVANSRNGQGRLAFASSSQVINTASFHPALDPSIDPHTDLKGYGSPVVAIKERLDAEAAEQNLSRSSTSVSTSAFKPSTNHGPAEPAPIRSAVSKSGPPGVPSSATIQPPPSHHNIANIISQIAPPPTPYTQTEELPHLPQSSNAIDSQNRYPPTPQPVSQHHRESSRREKARNRPSNHPQPQPHHHHATSEPLSMTAARPYTNTKSAPSGHDFVEEEEQPPVPPVRYNSLRKYDVAVVPSHHPESELAVIPASDTRESDQVQEEESNESSDEEEVTWPDWYQANISREAVLDYLDHEEVGRFIVRESTSHVGCYALSVKVPRFDSPSGITHYLIQQTPRGVKLKGLDKEWPTLESLVLHLTVMPELLPCTLKLPRAACNPVFDQEDHLQDAVDNQTDTITASSGAPGDEDYQRLSDFSSIMADLESTLQ